MQVARFAGGLFRQLCWSKEQRAQLKLDRALEHHPTLPILDILRGVDTYTSCNSVTRY